MNALWLERSITTEQAARLIQKSEPETHAILRQLVESGLVEECGQNKGRVWHLSAATYRALGEKAAYRKRDSLRSSLPRIAH